MQRHTFRAMGSNILVVLDKDVQAAAHHLAPVPDWFEEWEQHLSRFRPDSELSRLNRSAGEPQQVSDTLWSVLLAAREAAEQSDGLITPVVLDALEAAGYTRTFDDVAKQHQTATMTTTTMTMTNPAPSPTTDHHRTGNEWRAIEMLEMDEPTRTVYLPAGMRLDLGGIGKGWAAEQTMQRLRGAGAVLVDAGGDIAVSGTMADGQRWPVSLEHPDDPTVQIALLMLRGGGVATSGRDRRRWKVNGSWLHHIIDPRTGKPASTDVMRATVLAPTTRMAEMASKVVFLLGSNEGLAWLEEQPALAGLLVREDGTVLRSQRLIHHVW